MTPALLLIDLQNDFLAAPDLQPAAGQIVARAAALLEICRSHGIPVIHIWTTTQRTPDNRMPHWKAGGRWLCEAGTPGHAAPDPVQPAKDECVIHKQFFSGFGSPALEATLRTVQCDTLLLAGLHVHGCIRATALDGYQRGYGIWIVEDAVGSDDPPHAAITLRYLAQRAMRFTAVDQVREMLGGGKSRIEGSFIPANRLEHRSPRDKAHVLWNVPIDGAGEVAHAVGAAGRARAARQQNDATRIAESFHRLAELLTAEADKLAHQIAEDVGKPIAMARAEVRRSAALLHAVASRAAEPLQFQSGPGASYRYQPLGVVAVVTPWNNPLAIPLGRIAPALLYGNAVVWKPAPAATLIARKLLDLGRAADWGLGQEDIVTLCSGDRSTARVLAQDAGIDGLTLSGSLHAGYALQEICNRRHIPFQAEMGGNNAAIVWDDADLQRAAQQVAAGAFGFAGQRCTANRRVIVAEAVFAHFMRALCQATAALRWGDPFEETTIVGPLLTAAKRDEVSALLNRARAGGNQVLIPHRDQSDYGKLIEHGAYLPPTIVCASDPNSEIVREETFGPVLVVQRAANFERAIELANGVRQGLVAALFSNSPAHWDRFLAEARAGVLKLNTSTADADAVSPLGGWKASGIGPAEHGPSDREFFCRVQTLYTA